MLRLIFIFLAGLLLCAQTPIPGFPPGTFQNRAAIDAISGPVAATITYKDFGVDVSNGLTITFSAKTLGPVGSRIVVGLAARTLDTTAPSMTVDLVPTTEITGAAGVNLNATYSRLFITNSNSTNTTGNIVVTSNTVTPIARSGICIYNLTTITPTASSSGGAATTGTTLNTGSLTIPSNGVGVSVMGVRDDDATVPVTFTNATKDVDQTIQTAAGQIACGHPTSTGPITITGTIAAANELSMSTANWGP